MSYKTFVIGDIHGRLNALNEVLELSKFRDDTDTLIVLGDVVDGGSKTRGVIDRLLKIKNRVDILGNHDAWAMQWIDNGSSFGDYMLWHLQGGDATESSYGNDPLNVPESHRAFFKGMIPYYIDDMNRVFVHGGFKLRKSIRKQEMRVLLWDRSLVNRARYTKVSLYNHVFVGHTSTQLFKKITPITVNNFTMCDTGAGWSGKLSLINVNNLDEYYQSRIQVPRIEPDGEEDENEFEFGRV